MFLHYSSYFFCETMLDLFHGKKKNGKMNKCSRDTELHCRRNRGGHRCVCSLKTLCVSVFLLKPFWFVCLSVYVSTP